MAVDVYYIDYVNGLDTNNGKKVSSLTVDSTADTSHLTDAAITGMTIGAGSFVWNETRGIGALVTSFDDATDTLTLGSAIAGMTAGDSYSLITPFKTIRKYTTIDVRTAGDIAYVRANMTHTQGAANIIFDEAGTDAARIQLIGCYATGGIDPWHDGSDVKPIIDFAGQTYYWSSNADSYWTYKNLDIYNNASTAIGLMSIAAECKQLIFDRCDVHKQATSTSQGVIIGSASGEAESTEIYFLNCIFYNNDGNNVTANGGKIYFTNCQFNGGAETPTYGLEVCNGEFYLENCQFGVGTANAVGDIHIGTNGSAKVVCRGCSFTYDPPAVFGTSTGGARVFMTDINQVYGTHKAFLGLGTVEKVTDVTRSGGAGSSAKMLPGSVCSTTIPLSLNGDATTPDFRIWCAAQATTITVYIRGLNWSTYPIASQLFLQAEYVTDDTTGAITRATAVSTAVLTDNTTWVGLAVTFTPHVASFVNLKLYLGLYASTCGVYVDIKPVKS
jgi:hypothetical protein